MNYLQCWWKDVCDYQGTSDCSDNCIQFKEMRVLLRESCLPESQWGVKILSPDKCDLDAFRELKSVKDNINKFISEGNNLLICSKTPGNGKTTWSIKLMQSYFNSVFEGNGYKCRGVFVNVPRYFVRMKDNISVKDPEFEEMKSKLDNVDVVVWDDIATSVVSKYEYEQLLSVIDTRVFNKKANIFTTNVTTYSDMANLIGERLASRVYYSSKVVEFVGKDRRGL